MSVKKITQAVAVMSCFKKVFATFCSAIAIASDYVEKMVLIKIGFDGKAIAVKHQSNGKNDVKRQ